MNEEERDLHCWLLEGWLDLRLVEWELPIVDQRSYYLLLLEAVGVMTDRFGRKLYASRLKNSKTATMVLLGQSQGENGNNYNQSSNSNNNEE